MFSPIIHLTKLKTRSKSKEGIFILRIGCNGDTFIYGTQIFYKGIFKRVWYGRCHISYNLKATKVRLTFHSVHCRKKRKESLYDACCWATYYKAMALPSK